MQAAVAGRLWFIGQASPRWRAEVTACARFFQSAGLPGGIHQSIILFLYIIGIVFVTVCFGGWGVLCVCKYACFLCMTVSACKVENI